MDILDLLVGTACQAARDRWDHLDQWERRVVKVCLVMLDLQESWDPQDHPDMKEHVAARGKWEQRDSQAYLVHQDQKDLGDTKDPLALWDPQARTVIREMLDLPDPEARRAMLDQWAQSDQWGHQVNREL